MADCYLQQRRQSSAGPPVRKLPVPQPAPAHHSTLLSSTSLKRSHTAPVLSLNIPNAEDARKDGKEDRSMAVDDPETPTPEICHSPSWSDYGKEKRKIEKKKWEGEQKERKEAESREKKDNNRLKAAALRAGKRLSKKPPAAMETQRMPAALRTQSMISPVVSQLTSSEDSRRPSTESRRSSVTSIASIMGLSKPSSRRSVSLELPSPCNYEPIVSLTAPQLGRLSGIEFVSRDGSSSTQDYGLFSNGKPFGEEILKSKIPDLLTNTQQETLSKPLKDVRIRTPSQPFQLLDTPPPSRSTMEVGSSNPRTDASAEPKPLRSILARYGSSENGTLERRDVAPKGYQYPTYDRSSDEITKDEATKAAVAFDHAKHRRIVQCISSELPTTSNTQSTTLPTPGLPVSNDDVLPPSAGPFRDGGSYVHKQRMYQQQRSIAGYEDELSLLPRGQTWPPTPRDSAESVRKSQKESPRNTGSVEDDNLAQDMSTWHHDGLGDGKVRDRKATMESKNGFKIVKVLGPPEESKDGGVSPSPALGSHHRNITTPTKSSPLQPLRQGTAQPPAGGIPQKSTQRDNSAEVVKVGPTKNVDSPGNEKTSNSKADHSRTRTNSSQLLALDVQPRTVLPPTPTTPKSPAIENTPPKAVNHPPGTKDSSNHVKDSNRGRKSEPIVSVAAASHHTENVKAVPEVVIGGVDGDGLIRQTSLKQPRSDPELQVFTNPTKPPSVDFLPQLKHQPLTKPKRNSLIRVGFTGTPAEPTSPPSPSQFPVPISAIQSINKPPFSPSHPRRPSAKRPSSTGSSNPSDPLTANALTPKPLAKMFVICCKCKYWHDLPSKLYEAMALPRKIEAADKIAQSVGAVTGGEESRKIAKGFGRGKGGVGAGKEVEGAGKGKEKGKDKAVVAGVEGKVFTTVKCPWCEHGMSTACCAGWTAVVYLHEKHH